MQANYLKKLILPAVFMLLIGCRKEYTETISAINPLESLLKLKEGYVEGAGAKFEIWGERNFFTGYNRLVLTLYDSLNLKNKITDSHIMLMPVLTGKSGSTTTETGTPVENPYETAVNGVFPFAVVFTKPTDPDETWKLRILVHNHQLNKEGETSLDIEVDNQAFPRLTSFTSLSPDSSVLILTFIEPEKPKTGINDIEFSLYRKEGTMEFQPQDSYSIEFTPRMTGMGTSGGNTNPVNIGNGHYKGKVNFTMTGEWDIDVAVRRASYNVSGNISFKIKI